MEHKHWFEPPTLEVVVERGIRLIKETPRPIAFFHCPVPKSATAEFGEKDNLEAYLAPLKDLLPYLRKSASSTAIIRTFTLTLTFFGSQKRTTPSSTSASSTNTTRT